MEPADALTHPVALVVGASRGLGLLVARELCGRGHHVVIAARSAGELESAVPLVGPSERVTARVVDIRDRAQVKALVDDVEATVGPIEVLMTVAGIIQAGPAESVTTRARKRRYPSPSSRVRMRSAAPSMAWTSRWRSKAGPRFMDAVLQVQVRGASSRDGAQWIAWVDTDEEVATWTGCVPVLLLMLTTYDVIGSLMTRRDRGSR